MQAGGLDAEFLSVWVPPQLYPGEKAYKYSLDQFDAIDRLVAKNPDVAVLARTAAEVRNAAAAGKIAFLIGVEGGHGLGDAPDDRLIARLHEFYDRGARYMTLTWSNSNRLGGSSGDTGKTRGLTPFGLRVVKTMNDLGMMVDVSHVSDATFFDAVKASTKPVIASHSSARALCNHPRNMTDDMLRAVRDNGGAVVHQLRSGVPRPELVRPLVGAAEVSRRPDRQAREGAPGRPEGGHARISTELQGAGGTAPARAGVTSRRSHRTCRAGRGDRPRVPRQRLRRDPARPGRPRRCLQAPFITEELSRRGYSAGDIRKILGENVLRVLAANENKPAGDPSVALPGGEGASASTISATRAGCARCWPPRRAPEKLRPDRSRHAGGHVDRWIPARPPFQGGHDTGTTSADEETEACSSRPIASTRLLAVVDPSAKAIVSSAKLAGSPDYVRWVEAHRRAVGDRAGQLPGHRGSSRSAQARPRRPSTSRTSASRAAPSRSSSTPRARRRSRICGSVVDRGDRPPLMHVRWSPRGRTVAAARAASRSISRRGLLFAGCSEGKLSVLDIDHRRQAARRGVVRLRRSTSSRTARRWRTRICPAQRAPRWPSWASAAASVPTVLGTVPTARGAHCVAADDRGHAYVRESRPWPGSSSLPTRIPLSRSEAWRVRAWRPCSEKAPHAPEVGAPLPRSLWGCLRADFADSRSAWQ